MMRLAAACLTGLLLSPAALAQPVEKLLVGRALAIDGDTLLLQAEDGRELRVRLWGVDAPEMKDMPRGPQARAALDLLLSAARQRVWCEPRGRSYERIVALCTVVVGTANPQVVDLGQRMIRNGFAVEYRTYSKGVYQDDERAARVEKLGIWE